MMSQTSHNELLNHILELKEGVAGMKQQLKDISVKVAIHDKEINHRCPDRQRGLEDEFEDKLNTVNMAIQQDIKAIKKEVADIKNWQVKKDAVIIAGIAIAQFLFVMFVKG